MSSGQFTFDPKAATSTLCAALQNDRACLGISIVDETGELIDRKFYCKHYHVRLERKDTFLRRRRVAICKRCDQCLLDHPTGTQPDFDEEKISRFLN